MSAPQFTSGPWFGPNYNSSTAEPTLALTGKFKPKGHKSLSDYRLRVEVSGDNVVADSRLIAAAPDGYSIAARLVAHLRDDFRIPVNADEGWIVDTLGHALGGIYMDALVYLAKVAGQ